MKTMNRVMLIGHLGRKPDISQSKSGKPYTRLNLATHRFMGYAESGEAKELTEWHSVFVFGPLAERCHRFLDKGALLMVEGRLSYWREDKDGELRDKGYRNAIHADDITFITYRGNRVDAGAETENLDIPDGSRNHNAVAHLS